MKSSLGGGCPVFQIITLQNQIWDLEQLKQGGDQSAQLDKTMLGNKKAQYYQNSDLPIIKAQ